MTPTPALTALLDELDRLRATATPGPWGTDPYDDGADVCPARESDRLIATNATAADAALIVAAVNAVPRLTAAVRAVLDLAETLDAAGGQHVVTAGHLRYDIAAALEATP